MKKLKNYIKNLKYKIPEDIRYKIFYLPPWKKDYLSFYNYYFTSYFNRKRLKKEALPTYKKNNITVILSIKGYRKGIINALKSIRFQNYPQDLIKIILVDYDNNSKLNKKYKILCKRFKAKHIIIKDKPIWCKSEALNVGIKNAKSKYLLSTDADIIFEPNYFKECVKLLIKNPYQIIVSKCFKLPKKRIKNLKTRLYKKELEVIKNKNNKYSSGINFGITYFYKKIGGYDEYYKLIGYEDIDLTKRFKLLGLKIKELKKTKYFHQDHKKRITKKIKNQIIKNKKYFERNNTIVRNKNKT